MAGITFKRLPALAPLLFGAIMGCGSDSRGPTTDDVEIVDRGTVFCPSGTSYDPAFRMCESTTEAVGPFSKAMVASCKAGGGGDACDRDRWSAAIAERSRGKGLCPPGTSVDSKSGFCTSGNEAFGPFTKTLVARCKELSDNDDICEKMRWAKSFVADTRGLTGADLFCPLGTSYAANVRMCVSDKEAAGPFTDTMIDKCKSEKNDAATCEGSRRNVGVAKALRGGGRCPLGAALDPETGYCREGDNLFGPFHVSEVESCRANKGGGTCEGMRWQKSFITGSAVDPAGLPSCSPARAKGAVNRFERALLDVIAFAEGTRGQSNDGYNVTFGFRTFATCEHHPRMLVCEGLCSDAAGRYQFLSTTWEEVGLKTFTPDNQDRAAIQRVVGRGGHIPSDRPLSGAEFSALMDIISFEWASLPPGRFGQTAHSFGEVRSEYCRAVGGC